MNHTARAAGCYLAAGLSAVPVKPDGSKEIDLFTWKAYQARLATDEEWFAWFCSGGLCGVGIVAGAVSGNLEVIDCDDAAIVTPWMALVTEEAPGLVERLVCVQTPRPGFQFLYRCEIAVEGNQPLAREPVPGRVPPVRALIETRGEGGFVVAVGSPPECHPTGRTYGLLRGDLLNPPVLTIAERAVLLDCARSLNRYVEPEREVKARKPRPVTASGDLPPWADYNARGSWSDLLTGEGWSYVRTRGDVEHWRRPGKDRGISATLGAAGAGILYVFTTSSILAADHGYDLIGAYTRFRHGGDFPAASKALFAAGYGRRRQRAPIGILPPLVRPVGRPLPPLVRPVGVPIAELLERSR